MYEVVESEFFWMLVVMITLPFSFMVSLKCFRIRNVIPYVLHFGFVLIFTMIIRIRLEKFFLVDSQFLDILDVVIVTSYVTAVFIAVVWRIPAPVQSAAPQSMTLRFEQVQGNLNFVGTFDVTTASVEDLKALDEALDKIGFKPTTSSPQPNM